MDWAGDPKNKGKLTTIGKFLKDWWPALLGAWFLFATPLGAFTRTIIGTVAKLSFHLAKFAIPKLIKFAATNPLIAAGAVTGVAAGAGFMMEKNRTDEIAKRQGTTPEKRGQGDWFSEIGKAFNPGQLGMGGVSPMSRGGSVFSGVVDGNTGETVSGAGSDTQFLPIEGGGGAVLQRGESVLQVGARERMIRQAGVDPLAYNIGSNANKPRKINADTLASSGGLIGLNKGGEIGIAAHHLKQDEALSSLTPGINDFTRPGSSKWSKLTTNTPIHSYIDSVGKPTIGWGSTYYDSILNGKKPVKSGDKITKGKADNILATNISGLSKEYSTKIPHWNKMSNNQRAGLLVLGYNAPYGPIGAYPKLTKALQQGDIKSASQNIHREGPNAERIALEKSLLMSGPTNLKNLVGPKIVGEKKIGSGIPGIPPFLYNMSKGKKDGGLIKPSDGVRNPHSASDPILGALDRYEYIISKSGVRNAGGGSFERGAQFFDNLLAILDKNSNPAKQGKYNIEPPSRRNSVVTLPTISNTIGGNMGGNMNATKDRVVPGFSAISSVAQETRFRNAEIYGIG
jgi:GH24 family phage-related lysozyme (muramidase)